VILELGDGRELQLPDAMPDETARQLKTLILTCEQRARDAEARCEAMTSQIADLRSQVAALLAKPADNSATKAIEALRATIDAGLRQVVVATLADREMVADASGEYTRSKAVL
jgi:hypothetical protein